MEQLLLKMEREQEQEAGDTGYVPGAGAPAQSRCSPTAFRQNTSEEPSLSRRDSSVFHDASQQDLVLAPHEVGAGMSMGAWAQLGSGLQGVGGAMGSLRGATSTKAPSACGPQLSIRPGADPGLRQQTYPYGGSNPPAWNPTLPPSMHAQSRHENGGHLWQHEAYQQNCMPQQSNRLSSAQAELWEAWREVTTPAQPAQQMSIGARNPASQQMGPAPAGQAPAGQPTESTGGDPPPTPPSSSSDSSSDDESNDPGPDDHSSSDESETSKRSTKKKKRSWKTLKKWKREIRRKMLRHIQKFQAISRGFDDKVLEKNTMEVVGAIYNLRLQTDEEVVAYTKREKISSLKELRAIIMKEAPAVISTLCFLYPML